MLIVDDDEDDAFLIAEAFRHLPEKFEFTRLESGGKLSETLEGASPPDLIFLDLNMPGKNGAECLQEIRSNDQFIETPVMIYSTSSSKSDIETCYNRGASLYIVKPYFFDNIIRMAKSIMEYDFKKLRPFPPKDSFVLTFQ